MKKKHKNYIVDARIDGEEKFFTMKNVKRKEREDVALSIAQSLFCCTVILIVKYTEC